jgi:hypothetical protein
VGKWPIWWPPLLEVLEDARGWGDEDGPLEKCCLHGTLHLTFVPAHLGLWVERMTSLPAIREGVLAEATWKWGSVWSLSPSSNHSGQFSKAFEFVKRFYK